MAEPAAWYAEWVALHCTSTGMRAAAELLLTNEPILRGNWLASAGELASVTRRILERGYSCRFENELMPLLRRVLMELRAEGFDGGPAPADRTARPACRYCAGRGYVPVPIPECVTGEHFPRLVTHPFTGTVLTGITICDEPACAPGRRAGEREDKRGAKRPMSRFLPYCVRVDVAPATVLDLLARHETDLVERARSMPEFDGRVPRDLPRSHPQFAPKGRREPEPVAAAIDDVEEFFPTEPSEPSEAA